jgi:hypothetical protein
VLKAYTILKLVNLRKKRKFRAKALKVPLFNPLEVTKVNSETLRLTLDAFLVLMMIQTIRARKLNIKHKNTNQKLSWYLTDLLSVTKMSNLMNLKDRKIQFRKASL